MRFGAVEVLQQMQDEARARAALRVRFKELAPHVSPAAGERDLPGPGARKGIVGCIAIALDGAGKVHRHDLV